MNDTMAAGRGGHRPRQLIVVLGTATEVGKTWVTCELLRLLRAAGHTVAARKPVQSFASGAGPTDAELLGKASGEDPHTVCPAHRWYAMPMAPPMAVAALDREPFSVRDLTAELNWPAAVDVGFVETVGGVRSPLADDADSCDVAATLRPDAVLLVGDAGLGTISDVRLAVGALTAAIGRTPQVHLNRYDSGDDLHRRNQAWLRDRDRLPVATRPTELPAMLGL